MEMTTTAKNTMPGIDEVLETLRQCETFRSLTRFQYPGYDIDRSLEIVEAIGKSRNPRFTIDADNRFAYTNFIRWAHGDASMQAIDPRSGSAVPGRLMRGIYIAGSTGTGKSWCLEIMRGYCSALGFKMQTRDDLTPRPLWWNLTRSDAICDRYVETGSVQDFKTQTSLGIQDFGNEPQESLHMGNRLDVMRSVIEFRGDRTDQLTMITSNLKMGGDRLLERYGDRVASRLAEMCNYLEIRGKDRRKL